MFALAHFEIAHWKDIFPENFFIPKSTQATIGPRLTNFPTASRKPIATLPAYDFFLINPHRKWRHLDQILKKTFTIFSYHHHQHIPHHRRHHRGGEGGGE